MSGERNQHGIGELARLAGVTPRTIRYYVAQGLLPAPAGAGPGAHYGPGHLERLQLIKRLQRQHLPLAEIRARLAVLTDEQVSEVNRAGVSAPQPGSALDYIQAVLGGARLGGARAPAGEPPTLALQAARLPVPSLRPTAPPPRPASGRLLARLVEGVAEPGVAEPGVAEATITTTEPTVERSQWERLSLGPNLELHVRRPLGRFEQRRVERLITIARQVLKEETP